MSLRDPKPATSVVVVEDDPASADVLQRRLQANGMIVAVGRDGAEGDAADGARPDSAARRPATRRTPA